MFCLNCITIIIEVQLKYLVGRLLQQYGEKFYEALSEMQKDLETYLAYYNEKRAHQGRNMKGRTPKQAFLDEIKTDKKSGDAA